MDNADIYFGIVGGVEHFAAFEANLDSFPEVLPLFKRFSVFCRRFQAFSGVCQGFLDILG